MGCPKYEDNTRTCVEEFTEVINFVSFDFCESDEYGNCPIYKLIKGEAKPCEFLKECRIHFSKMPSEKADFKTALMDGMNKLCLSDKNVTCEIYKLRKDNKNIPEGLLPNSSILELNI
jgi:hypothetical protein